MKITASKQGVSGDIFRLTVSLNAEHSPEAEGEIGQKTSLKGGMKGGMKTADAIVALMKADPQITHDMLAAKTGKVRNSIIKQIASLKKAGLIRRVGPDKGGHWEVME